MIAWYKTKVVGSDTQNSNIFLNLFPLCHNWVVLSVRLWKGMNKEWRFMFKMACKGRWPWMAFDSKDIVSWPFLIIIFMLFFSIRMVSFKGFKTGQTHTLLYNVTVSTSSEPFGLLFRWLYLKILFSFYVGMQYFLPCIFANRYCSELD